MGLSIDFGILPSQFKGLEFFMVLMGVARPSQPQIASRLETNTQRRWPERRGKSWQSVAWEFYV